MGPENGRRPPGDGRPGAALEAIPSPVGLLAVTRDTAGAPGVEVVYANPAFAALIDACSPVAAGSGPDPRSARVLSLWRGMPADDAIRRLADVTASGRPWRRRARTGGLPGCPEWIEVVASPAGEAVSVWLRDVSREEADRVQLDEVQVAYRTLLDALPDRVVGVVDADLRVRFVAGSGLARTRIDPVPTVGSRVGDVFPPAQRDFVEAQVRAALAGEHVVVPEAVAPQGTVWRIDLAPLPGDDGTVRSVMAVGLDITAEVEARAERDRTLRELQQAQRMARTGSWSWDARTGATWRSAELLRLLDLPPDVGVEEELAALARRSPDAARARDAWDRALAGRQPLELELRLGAADGDPDGGLRYLVVRAAPIVEVRGDLGGVGAEGAVTGVVTGMRGTVQDVTEAYQARQALAESEERFRLAFDESPIGKALLAPPPDDAARVLRVNRALCTLLGRPADKLVGTSLWDWVHPEDRDAARAAVRPGGPGLRAGARAEVRLAADPGRQVWAGVGATTVRDVEERPLYLLAQIEDVTARRLAEDELVRQARSDPLTDLPNRLSLLEHLGRTLADGPPVAVLFLDLDDFKTVNDSLGHAAGDQLLARVAVRIGRHLGEGDFAARWGGDEFVVVSPSHAEPSAARALADRIRLAVGEPVAVDGHEVAATVSIGVALGGAASTVDGLLRDADIAMYRAKAAGKDRWALADSAGHEGAMRRLTVASALRHALDGDQLELLYQPVVDLVGGRPVAVEALLRWRHPERGLLGPEEFLDVAESSALIVPVGEWALRTAVFQAMAWYRRFGSRAPSVAVNVSVRQLGHARLHERVAAALAGSGLPPDRLCLELTEREAVAASGAEAADLQAVHATGVRLAVDDFGTGYAGLDYLRRFPVDILKIDQSFVRGLGSDPTDTAIIVSLITLGRALDVVVVAEGVEDETRLAMLRRLECPQGQGRLWSPPVAPEAIEELLLRGLPGG